jgi:hypothetical protein
MTAGSVARSREMMQRMQLSNSQGAKDIETVIASEAKQSIAARKEWIASSLRSSQ